MDAYNKEKGVRSLRETESAAAAKEQFVRKELSVTVQFNGQGLPQNGYVAVREKGQSRLCPFAVVQY